YSPGGAGRRRSAVVRNAVRVSRLEPGLDLQGRLLSLRLAYGDQLARRRYRGHVVGPEDRAQRILRLFAVGRTSGRQPRRTLGTLGGTDYLCSLWLFQLQLHRHSDRRTRGAGSSAEVGVGIARSK